MEKSLVKNNADAEKLQSAPSWIWYLLVSFIVIISLIIFIPFMCNGGENEKEATNTTNLTSGKGVATLATPVKAYLDPLKSHTTVWGKGHTKFVLASDPSVYFICACKKPDGGEAGDPSSWWAMPAGEYLVYPYGVEKIQFSWY